FTGWPFHVLITRKWVCISVCKCGPWAVKAGSSPGAEHAWATWPGFDQQQVLVLAIEFVHVRRFKQILVAVAAMIAHYNGVTGEVREVADGGFRHVQLAVIP